MTLLPIFVRLEGQPVLVVGAGSVALSKIESLRAAGAAITVVAPAAVPSVQDLAKDGDILWHQRPFIPDDLDGVFLVIAATNDSDVNRAVYGEARVRNVLCNAVDDPPNCDFYFGSVVRRGDLQIAISTGGESPALAQRLRREIDAQLPVGAGEWLAEIGSVRREIRTVLPASAARTALLHDLAHLPLCSSPMCSTRQWARQTVATLQEEAKA